MKIQLYSVLMSVYAREKPEYLKLSMESMFSQTVPTDDFVLVCDGPLTKELNAVIAEMQKRYAKILRIVRLKENMGLGNALREGILHCRHAFIARMDSDDISRPERCEKQLTKFQNEPSLDIVSGTVEEFPETPAHITGKRVLPQSHEEICAFSRKRNPFNHPAVMYKKDAVLKAGNYDGSYPLFEDYFLWIRMLTSGCRAGNMREPLLYMRTPEDIYHRRGGTAYAKNMLLFHRWMRKSGWSSWWDYFLGAVPHALVCVMPNHLRKGLYSLLRRKNEFH